MTIGDPGGPHDDYPGGDEELRHGVDRLPPRLRRPATVVLVAVAGLAVAWVTSRLGEGDGTSAAPTPGVSASASVSGSTGGSSAAPSRSTVTFSASGVVVPVPSGSLVIALPVPALTTPTCPAGLRCTTTDAVPAPVLAALRDNYAGARIVSSRTLTRTVANSTSLVGRSISAVAGARRFDIAVGPYVMGPDSFDRQDDGDTSTVAVDSASGPADQTVHLLLTEPRTSRPNDLTVVRLARDARLSALR